MADQKNRGGQKKGGQKPSESTAHQGTTTGGAAERSDVDKQKDQRSNPDDAKRKPTDEQR